MEKEITPILQLPKLIWKNRLKTQRANQKAVSWRTDNAMIKRKMTKWQTMIYKILQRKLNSKNDKTKPCKAISHEWEKKQRVNMTKLNHANL